MVSAKTGEGFDDWLNWLKMKVKGKKRNITKKTKRQRNYSSAFLISIHYDSMGIFLPLASSFLGSLISSTPFLNFAETLDSSISVGNGMDL